uniref:AAA+ ATPase domain-containing protein n=2 Tax=Photinus pyralis TaxID=7054 RepID=A0A1Y1MB90_PHOPY
MEICPVCFKEFPTNELENHVETCLFLHSSDTSSEPNRTRGRKRSSVLLCNGGPSTSKHAKLQSITNPLTFKRPLPLEMQPSSLDNFFGHSEILGKGSELRSLLCKGEVPNMVLWGPPGCGKTSLANIIRGMCEKSFTKLRYIGTCGVNCGGRDLEKIIMEAEKAVKLGLHMVVFIDEIHQLSKRLQDVLWEYILRGTLTLIGATTENPSFCIKSALLNLLRVIVMQKLKRSDLIAILEDTTRQLSINVVHNKLFQGTNCKRPVITHSDITWLVDTSDGDARIALNNLQLMLCHDGYGSIKSEMKKSHMMYDRRGEEHHNTIAAMHESIRGSNDNAAIYWTARMLVSGEDPLFIARRLVRAASEEMGNSDPNSLQLAVSTMHGCQLLDRGDREVLLAQCALYLARAPTLKREYFRLEKVKQVIADCHGPQPSVPFHLRNIPEKLLAELGVDNKRSFMPEGMEHLKFY